LFLDASGLVEYEVENSSLDKLEWGCAERSVFFFFIRAVHRGKYLKRRIKYSYGHPGPFNPAVITNKEACMIYGNKNKEAGSSQVTGLVKKKRSKITDFFPKTEQHSFEG